LSLDKLFVIIGKLLSLMGLQRARLCLPVLLKDVNKLREIG
jgi:hypothetical protein